ncbi:hypothetical protein [Pontiella agarivorans]|uniref:Uncharacterized protein n=1 Tax=Pontiella agarivorans TaxID=3038953 RepID=A0ABU5MYX6_9BACT|nr:hypothetical protein [Pontiella agarivorans]MDZ8119390.1 hypothetical protein [Pontiella agarivorans]
MNIDFSNLSKEQKQYLLLGIFGIAAVGYGLFIGLSKVGGSLSDTKNELEDLNAKIDRTERELGQRSKTLRDFEQTITVLESHLDNLPPEENYYAWATEIIYSKGRSAGLQVESVDEVVTDSSTAKNMKDPVYFETYSLRILARGDYAATKAFINDIEKNHPLVRFTGIDISRGRDPEKHAVQLSVQWPHKLQRIADLWKGQRRSPVSVIAAKELRPEPVSAPVQAAVPVRTVAEAEAELGEVGGLKEAANPPPDYTPPAPVVLRRKTEPEVKPAPEPDSETVVPSVTQMEPKEVSAPVIVKAESEAVPALEPETVVPSVTQMEPKEVSAPVIVKAESEAVPALEPETAEPSVTQMEPKEVSAPVIVKAEPEAVPALEPETVVPSVTHMEPKEVSVPVIVKNELGPGPNMAEIDSRPENDIASSPSPEPEVDAGVMVDLRSATDRLESGKADAQKENPAVDDQMATLLASLDSRGTKPEEVPVFIGPAMPSDAEDLKNYVNQLAVQSESAEAEENVQQETVVAEIPEAADLPVVYVSSGKSARILEDLLMRDEPKASKTLGSFLDDIVEDINESR